MRISLSFALALNFAAVSAPAVRADDWPQWMGPTRDAVWKETGILEAFPADGPKKLWSKPVAGGYSGPAVADGKVYVFDYDRTEGDATNNPAKRGELKGKERVHCLDAKTGAPVWKHEYDCAYSISYPCGPRCTPTVAGGKVYAVGAMGDLTCLDAAKGTVVWSKNFPKDYGAKPPVWGFAGHPLVYKNLVICLVGGDGSVAVAFDKDTGKEKWKALSAPEPGYCPPTLVTTVHPPERHAGGDVRAGGDTTQLVIWHAKSVNGLNPDTGEKYWSVPLEPKYGMAIMAPRLAGDTLFAGGIGHVSAAIKLGGPKPTAEVVWRGKKDNALDPINATPFVQDGVIYGVDQPGQFRAVKLATGERLWSTFQPTTGAEQDDDFKGAGSGTVFVVKNGDRFFLFAETGHLIIAKLTAEKYTEVGRAKLVEPTGEAFGRKVVWTHPAFADKCVFVRNDKEIACFSLAKE